jgi:hypothetical protein
MSENHAYPGKTVNAVIALKVVSINFTDQITELSTVQTTWTPAYATDLGKRVDTVSETYLGVRTRDELFRATTVLNQLITPAKDDLETVKLNIKINFVSDKNKQLELQSKLGFNTGVTIGKMTHSELVALLLTFKRELTPALLAELTAKGLHADVPNRIIAAAPLINDANSTQEKLKISTKEANDTIIREINKLYTEIIGICKLAADHYKRDAVKKEMFTFSKILHNLGETKETKKTKAEKTAKAATEAQDTSTK